MYLKNLRVFQFKNYADASIALGPHINCLVGPNGSGKTNILDAVHYLALTKSYFQSVDLLSIMHGQASVYIEGKFIHEQFDTLVSLAWSHSEKKRLKVNNNDVPKQASHIGHIPVVMITPYDVLMILETSEVRRKWMDGIISQTNKQYLANLMSYNRVLEQRNRQLKNHLAGHSLDPLLIEAYDQQLQDLGNAIYDVRKQFLGVFMPLFLEFYQKISNSSEEVSIVYQSHLLSQSMQTLLAQSRQLDMQTGRTNRGPHKDELEFVLNHYLIKKHGSQGQQKSFIIALKLAQFAYIKSQCGFAPILLLDDIFEKLDATRLQLLLSMMADSFFGQIIITDTHLERTQQIFSQLQIPQQYFIVNAGKILQL